MDMKVDSSYIKAQRVRRAWSQEHLAEVSGLGLRTIQRIEKTGAASYESARSLAAVFEMDVADLRVAERVVVEPRRVNLSMRQVLGVVGDDGALVPEVNDLKLGDLRFSIVPRVQTADRILLEVSIYERRGDEEVVVSEPRLIALSGEAASVVLDDDARTVRLAITAEVNPPLLPPTLKAR